MKTLFISLSAIAFMATAVDTVNGELTNSDKTKVQT